MSDIRLSICIPTYNFSAFIGKTLKSVIDQASDDVEIVVVDGASTDNTADVVRDYQKHFPGLHYHLLMEKGGIDRDLAKAVELARGDYCWLLSSDDVIRKGAINTISRMINEGYDVYLCNRIECDRYLNPVHNRLWLSKKTGNAVFDLSQKPGLLSYLNEAKSIGALFSYMSSIIVNRRKWNEIGYDERFTGTNYAHAYRLLALLKKGGLLKYIKDPLVLCRGDNDSFLRNGTARRFLIDVDGYRLLGSHLYNDENILHAFNAVVRREFRWYALAGVSSEVDNLGDWRQIERKLLSLGYSRTALRLVRVLGSSKFFAIVARRLRKALRQLRFQKSV